MFYEFNHLGSPDYLRTESGRNFSFPLHLHQCFEFITVLAGQMQITVDGRRFLMQAGDALLIFPNQIHSLQSSESEHLLCIFSPQLVQAFATKLSGRIPENNQFRPDAYLTEALARLTPSSTTTEKKGVLYSLCAQFEKDAVYVKRQSERESLLFEIFSFVENEYRGDCSLSGLSRSLGYDYSYLSRYFKNAVGISFNAYVNHYRLSHACYLMENSALPIIECAYESGFTSLRSFNRNFKGYFRVTPAQYRKGILPPADVPAEKQLPPPQTLPIRRP